MSAVWVVYAAALGALVGLGALVAERLLWLAGRPRRWAWAAGMALTLVLPAVLPLVSARFPAAAPGAGAGGVVLGEPVLVRAGEAGGGAPAWARVEARLGGWVVPLWAAGSAGLAAYLLGCARVLARRRRGWRVGRVGGERVLLAPETGPAVVGVRRPEIVLPERVLGWEEARQRLIVRHEREHLEAGDPRLLAAALLALVAMPWNAALWWQLRRLRLAMEVDCDARVLRAAGGDRRRYAGLLLEVGGWPRHSVPAGAGFAEPGSFLERRLHAMTTTIPKHRALRVALLAAVLAGAAAAAHALPRPPAPPAAPVPAGPEAERRAPVEPVDTPQLSQLDVRPELRNRSEVERLLQASYPAMLRDAGIGGTVDLWVLVDPGGAVARTQVRRSSGYPQLDAAAETVARGMRFSPAQNGGEAVEAWIRMPILFDAARAAEARVLQVVEVPPIVPIPSEELQPARAPSAPGAAPAPPGETRPARAPVPPAPAGDVRPVEAPRPQFTPFDVRPELRNRLEVARALEAAYPPLLRDAGIGGTAQLWILIDAEGVVSRVQRHRGSGYPQLDEAAEAVAREMRFSPAQNRGEPVPVWIQVPVSFTTTRVGAAASG